MNNYTAIITRNGFPCHSTVPAKTTFAATCKALDYIDEEVDAGNYDHGNYGYEIIDGAGNVVDAETIAAEPIAF